MTPPRCSKIMRASSGVERTLVSINWHAQTRNRLSASWTWGCQWTLRGPFVQTLLEDRQGTLWFGTIGSGLYRHLSDGHTDRYTAQHGLLSNDVRALLEDRQGHLWAGTRTGLDRKSTRLNSSHGYISYAVFCLKKKKKKSNPQTSP